MATEKPSVTLTAPASFAETRACHGWKAVLDDKERRSFVALRCGAFETAQLRDWQWLCENKLQWERPGSSEGDYLPREAVWLVSSGCSCSYGYAQRSWQPRAMEPWFVQLTETVCKMCDINDLPNSCNVNRYVGGSESVGWHADDEDLFDALNRDALVLSLSLGVTRTFKLRRMGSNGSHDIAIPLNDGDLCTMEGLCQKFYQHCVPKEPSVGGTRINLTWRWIVAHGKDCPLGVPEGPLRQKLQDLADAKEKLERMKQLKRQRETLCESHASSLDPAAKLMRLAKARQQLAEMKRRRAEVVARAPATSVDEARGSESQRHTSAKAEHQAAPE